MFPRLTHVVERQYFIPVCGQIIFHCMDRPHCLSMRQLIDIWAIFTYWKLINNAGINIPVQIFVQTCGFHVGVHLRVEIAGSHNNSVFNFMRNYQTFFQNGHTMLHSISNVWRVWFFHILPTPVIFWVFDHSHPRGNEVVSHCGFDLHFPYDKLLFFKSFLFFILEFVNSVVLVSDFLMFS